MQRIAWDLYDAVERRDTVAARLRADVRRLRERTAHRRAAHEPVPVHHGAEARPEFRRRRSTSWSRRSGVPGTSLGIVSTTMTPTPAPRRTAAWRRVGRPVLPVYTRHAVGPTVRLCSSSSRRDRPRPWPAPRTTSSAIGASCVSACRARARYGSSSVARRATPPAPGSPMPDPDFVLSQAADVTVAEIETPRVEDLDLRCDRRRLRARGLRMSATSIPSEASPSRTHVHDRHHHRLSNTVAQAIRNTAMMRVHHCPSRRQRPRGRRARRRARRLRRGEDEAAARPARDQRRRARRCARHAAGGGRGQAHGQCRGDRQDLRAGRPEVRRAHQARRRPAVRDRTRASCRGLRRTRSRSR